MIPEGDYVISVSFDNQRLIDPPSASCDHYVLHVAKEPSPLAPEAKLDKQLELARLALVRDDPATASTLIGNVLQADPENIGALRIKAALLVGEGKTGEAVSALDRALGSYYKRYPKACPPAGLLSERSAILSKIKLETASAANPR